MANFPALPLWTDAYLADTAHLSDAENGLYIRLLILIWRSPKCRIPNDDSWLSRRFSDVGAVRALIKEFCFCDGNWIKQKRLFREWKYVNTKRLKQSVKAKSRWEKEKDLYHGNAPTPTPIPTPIEEENKIVSFNEVRAGKTGNGKEGLSRDYKISKFQIWLSKQFPDQKIGWMTIMAASDPSHKDHKLALSACIETARQHGKGWPHKWLPNS